MSPDRLAILRGTLDVMVLRAVSDRPRHGFEISLWLEEHARAALHLDDSALYQSLHRLADRGLLKSDWGISANNRRARYYELTAKGRKHLDAEGARLISFASAILAVLGGKRSS